MGYSKDKKTKLIGFSPKEWEIVCRKAKAAEMRTGTYIRKMAVHGEVKLFDINDWIAIRGALGRIGSNLNQIAKVANSTNSVTQKDIADMREEFEYFGRAVKYYLYDIFPEIMG